MTRCRPGHGLALSLLSALCLLVGSLAAPPPSPAEAGGRIPGVRAAWVQITPDGGSVRVITDRGDCPLLSVEGRPRAMTERAGPNEAFPALVCEAPLARGERAQLAGVPLPSVPSQPRRIVVVGDTGCRVIATFGQACSDPSAWPWPRIAASAARESPDLVIHIGDYIYREGPCPAGNAGCAGSPWGDNQPTWDTELFTAAAPLLAAAPWVMTRGNHEDCHRAGNGWFRFLDPAPVPPVCRIYTDPYVARFAGLTLVIVDSAHADDAEARPDQVDEYRRQLAAVQRDAGPAAWLLTHRPIWSAGNAAASGPPRYFTLNAVLAAAIEPLLPYPVGAIIAGHQHLFAALQTSGGRPPQLIIGNGGTALDFPVGRLPPGYVSGGAAIEDSRFVVEFGYAVLEPSVAGWLVTMKDPSGRGYAVCRLAAAGLTCDP